MSKTKIDELEVLISANSSKFNNEIAKVRDGLGKVGQNAKNAGGSIAGRFSRAQLALEGIKFGLRAISGAVKKAASEFGGLEQNLGGADAVFGEFADAVKQKSKESARTMGTSMNQYLSSANKMGSLFQGMGFDAQKSMAMTTQAMQRASDVASVMGTSQESALESLTAMAKGNFTMMDNLGVAMNDTNIQAWLLEKGIQANVNAMTTAEKVGWAYEMFMDRTSKHAGNFARESTTLQGSLAILKAELSNVAATLGSAFAPVVLSVANFVSNVLAPAINACIPYVVGFMKVIGTMVNYVISALSALFGVTKSSMGGISKSVAPASSGMKSLGTNAGNAGGGMNKAAGGAKKLKKELLGLSKFDEMNVLKTPDEPSGGGGGGSGGGGGGVEMPEIATPDFGKFENAFDGINKKAEEIANNIKRFFEGVFDFKKIGNAFKRFWGDIIKGGKPVFEILGDIWKNYLKPFFGWVGDDLLPAFLNALGGAIQLLGVALKSAYQIAKPFIDSFIIPLAKFAGGMIVGFLNLLGDAFRKIAQNKGLVEFLTGVTMAISGLIVAIKAADAVDKLNMKFRVFHNILANGSSQAAIGAVQDKLGLLGSAYVKAGGGIAGLKAALLTLAGTIKTSVLGVLSAVMAHPLVLGVAGLVAGVLWIGGSIKSAFEQGNPALWESEARTKALKKAQDDLKEATDEVKTAEESLNNARASQVDSQIAYTEAIKRQEEAQQNLANILASSNITESEKAEIIKRGAENYAELDERSRSVYDAHLQLESANARVETSQNSLNKATEEAKKKSEELAEAKKQEKAQLMANATSQAVIEGKYKNSTAALEALKNGTLEYKDENSKMVKASSKDIEDLEGTVKERSQGIVGAYRDTKSGADQGFFGPMGRSLARAGDELGKFAGWAGQKFGEFAGWAKRAGSDARHGITSFFGGIGQWFSDRWEDAKNAFSGAWQDFSNIGRNIWEGLKAGIGNLASKIGSMFKNAVDGVKNFLGIHSPSRLFRSYGGFVGEGFALGIDSEQKTISKAFERMTDFDVPKYRIKTDFDFATPNFATNEAVRLQAEYQGRFSENQATAIEKLETAIKSQKQQITVKVGEDTLVDRIIDGVNQRSFMENRTVFDV